MLNLSWIQGLWYVFLGLQDVKVVQLFLHVKQEVDLRLAYIQKDYQKEATNAKARAKRVRDNNKVYKDFFKKLGGRDLKNRDYESFFRDLGTDEMKKLGFDPDEIRLKLETLTR